MKHFKTYIFLFFITLLPFSCGQNLQIPDNCSTVNTEALIYPDYKEVTIPKNIAPLNFKIENDGEEFIVNIKGKNNSILVGAEKDGKVHIDSVAWRNLLADANGSSIELQVYSLSNGKWLKHPSFKINVAKEPIDPFLFYRLIEPSYELYRQLGIYQRNLENFTEEAVYTNNRSYEEKNNHCVNCHSFQNYSSQRMLFHVRAKHGGTVLIDHNGVRKLNMRCDSILSNTVYPSWHPTENIVAFSSNKTGQAFHMVNNQKVEVIDFGSDLVLFDVEKGVLSNILKTKDNMETFPSWSPDGRKLYYCNARVPELALLPDSTHSNYVLSKYDSIHYDIMSISFDKEKRTFGQPVVEVNCDSMNKSATVPRVSPDGKFLLFTLGDYGQFHIWHNSADLYIKNLESNEIIPLTFANSEKAESYHTWSSNGRWIVFVSRRENGSFSRVFISYFDRNGNAHKAFLLPQEDPEHNLLRLKSYNVPELSKDPVRFSYNELKEVIYNDNDMHNVIYQDLGTQDK